MNRKAEIAVNKIKRRDDSVPEKYGDSGKVLWRGAVLTKSDLKYLKMFADSSNSSRSIASTFGVRVSSAWNASCRLRKKLGFASRLEMSIEAYKHLDALT